MNYNYNLAKVNADGTLEYAPTEFINVSGLDIIDPMGRFAKTQGYLPVIETQLPEQVAGFKYQFHYEELDKKAVRVWEKIAVEPIEFVEPPPNPYEDELSQLKARVELQSAALAKLGVSIEIPEEAPTTT